MIYYSALQITYSQGPRVFFGIINFAKFLNFLRRRFVISLSSSIGELRLLKKAGILCFCLNSVERGRKRI